jgi:hypothetical protein
MPDGHGPRNNSRLVGGKTAAPGLGASLATLTTPPAGYYRIECWFGLSGTLAAVDASNAELRAGTTVLASLANSGAVSASGNAVAGPFTVFRQLDGSTTLTINATAASTASSVYHATLIATKLD